jgi:ABC-type antimicrobial peptide transport system permease subunit
MTTKQGILSCLWGALLGFGLGVCGVSIVSNPLLFFVIDIPLLIIGILAICTISK